MVGLDTCRQFSKKLTEELSLDELQELVDNKYLCLPFYRLDEGVPLKCGKVSIKVTKAVNSVWHKLNKELTVQVQQNLKEHIDSCGKLSVKATPPKPPEDRILKEGESPIKPKHQ